MGKRKYRQSLLHANVAVFALAIVACITSATSSQLSASLSLSSAGKAFTDFLCQSKVWCPSADATVQEGAPADAVTAVQNDFSPTAPGTSTTAAATDDQTKTEKCATFNANGFTPVESGDDYTVEGKGMVWKIMGSNDDCLVQVSVRSPTGTRIVSLGSQPGSSVVAEGMRVKNAGAGYITVEPTGGVSGNSFAISFAGTTVDIVPGESLARAPQPIVTDQAVTATSTVTSAVPSTTVAVAQPVVPVSTTVSATSTTVAATHTGDCKTALEYGLKWVASTCTETPAPTTVMMVNPSGADTPGMMGLNTQPVSTTVATNTQAERSMPTWKRDVPYAVFMMQVLEQMENSKMQPNNGTQFVSAPLVQPAGDLNPVATSTVAPTTTISNTLAPTQNQVLVPVVTPLGTYFVPVTSVPTTNPYQFVSTPTLNPTIPLMPVSSSSASSTLTAMPPLVGPINAGSSSSTLTTTLPLFGNTSSSASSLHTAPPLLPNTTTVGPTQITTTPPIMGTSSSAHASSLNPAVPLNGAAPSPTNYVSPMTY